MLTIHKLRDDMTIDFAAQELRKYLRMMQPDENQITITAKDGDGFRLGLLQDFGLPNDAPDPVMDDIVHIETTEKGGILAGSNPRSVLFAVYRLLKLNGCRFLFPGAEGERIPVKPLKPQSYHKAADHRYRGRTIEGRPSFEQVLASLDFYAKEELNAFGCYGVAGYHSYYYLHRHNTANREPEFFDIDLADSQWRGLYEAEAQKRGVMILSGEHEMVPNALGLSENDRFLYKEGKKELPADVYPRLAMMNGERKLHKNDILFTNVCMSQPDLREKMAQVVVHEIENRPHLQIFGCTVADTSRNHCECEACLLKLPSDWYVMILNRIDQLLTEKNIPTKVLFSFYVDMIFAPEMEKLNNPDRFVFQYCPISRSYTASLPEDAVYPEPPKYVRNGWEPPKNEKVLMALFRKWKEVFPGPCSVFEYHYWVHQFREPGMLTMARRVYEDVRSYKYTGMDGCMEDGSNRSFWPNGFLMHIYNETLMNRDCDFDGEVADFFQNAYGENWVYAKNYLQGISDAFDHKYMCGERSADPKQGTHYNPAHAASLAKVETLAKDLQAFVKTLTYTHRVEYLSWKLLCYHADFCCGLAKALILKCQGDTPGAIESFDAFLAEFGKNDVALERWFDFELAAQSLKVIVKQMPKVEF